MDRYWLREGRIFAALLAFSIVMGVLTGYPAAFIILGLAGYLGLNGYKLYRLSRWLFYKHEPEPRFGEDLWGEVLYQIQRRKARARKRERKLKA